VRALGSLGGAIGNIGQMAVGFAAGGVLGQAPGMLLDMAKGAAADAQATARLSQTLENLPGNFGQMYDSVNKAIDAGQKLAFTDDDIRDSFQYLATATGSSEEALKRQKIAMDLARGANIPMAQASKLVGKVNEENVDTFKKLGINIKEGATEAQALAAVQAKFAGQAETYANSTAGQFEQAQIAMSEIGETIGGALLPAFNLLAGVLVDNLPAIQEFIATVSDGFAEMFDEFITNVLPSLQAGFQSVMTFIQPVIDMLPTIATALGQVFAFMRDGTGDIEVFRGILNKLIGPQGAQGVIEIFTNLVGFFRSAVIPLWQGLADAASKALSGDLQGALSTAAAALGAYGSTIISSLAEWARRFIEWVAPMIPPMLAELGKLLVQLGTWIVTVAAPAIISKLLEWAKAFITWVVPLIPPFLVEVGKILAAIGGWITGTALPAIISKLIEWGAAFLDWVKVEVLPKLPGALEAIKTKAGEFITGAVEWLKTEAGKLGTAILDGIKNALNAGAERVNQALRDMANGALNAAKTSLGISSPSRVFATEVGDPIIQGVIAGIEAAGPALLDATRDVLGAAVVELTLTLEQADAALVGLGDQLNAAEKDLKQTEQALKPFQKAFDAASANVKKLKDLLGDLQSELSNIGGGGIDLPGEADLKQTIFGLGNAINILEQQKRELLRAGVKKDDPEIKEIDKEIERNKEELEYQQGRLKAEYDGQRNALEQAAQAGTRVTQTFEDQYKRILDIKNEQMVINTEHLPAMLALEEQSKLALEGAHLAVEAQKEVVDKLKEDYEKLKELTEKWKDQLDKVLDKAKDIKKTLGDALDLKRKLGAGDGDGGGDTTTATATRLGAATVTIYNDIDATGQPPQLVAQAWGMTLGEAMQKQLISGVR
jgi:phage-related protein